MQPNKTKLALTIGAMLLGASNASSAATGTFDITITTIADVTLVEEDALDFGTNVFTTVGNCTMLANGGSDTTMLIDRGSAQAADDGATYGRLDGSSCIAGDGLGTPGRYRVVGTTGATVNVSFAPVTGTGFTFSPTQAFASDYNLVVGSATIGDDDVIALAAGAPTAVRLATTAEGAAEPVDASLIIAVGGLLTLTAPQTADTPVEGDFVVTVTY
jgi:hypothetical protein